MWIVAMSGLSSVSTVCVGLHGNKACTAHARGIIVINNCLTWVGLSSLIDIWACRRWCNNADKDAGRVDGKPCTVFVTAAAGTWVLLYLLHVTAASYKRTAHALQPAMLLLASCGCAYVPSEFLCCNITVQYIRCCGQCWGSGLVCVFLS